MAAHIYTGQIDYETSESWNQKMYELVHPWDNRISYDSSENWITFDNKIKLNFRFINSDESILVKDINDSLICGFPNTGIIQRNRPVTYIKDDNFICYTESPGTTHAVRWFYIKQGEEIFFCFMYNYWYAYQIDNSGQQKYDFLKLSARAKSCIFPKNFNYSVISPKVMFSDTAVILDSAGNPTKIDCLKTCSIVTPDSTVEVNNKHYYALGTNTLIEVENS